jgi:hypothetical protein
MKRKLPAQKKKTLQIEASLYDALLNELQDYLAPYPGKWKYIGDIGLHIEVLPTTLYSLPIPDHNYMKVMS